MRLNEYCSSYFKGLPELSKFKSNSRVQNRDALLKVASLLTVIVPLVVGAVWLVSNLIGRISKTPPKNAQQIQVVADEIIGNIQTQENLSEKEPSSGTDQSALEFSLQCKINALSRSKKEDIEQALDLFSTHLKEKRDSDQVLKSLTSFLVDAYFKPENEAMKVEIGKALEKLRPTFVASANPLVRREDRDRYRAIVLKLSNPAEDKEALFNACFADCLKIEDHPLRIKAYETCLELDCKASQEKKGENWKVQLSTENGEVKELLISPAEKQILWDLAPYFHGLSAFNEGTSKIIDFTRRDEINETTFALFLNSITFGKIEDWDAAIQVIEVASSLNMKHAFAESWCIKAINALDINSTEDFNTALAFAEFDLRALNISDTLINDLSSYLAGACLEEAVFSRLETLKPKALDLSKGQKITQEKDLKRIWKLTSLESLHLGYFSKLTKDGFNGIEQLASLKKLTFVCPEIEHKISSDAMGSIYNLEGLEELTFTGLRDRSGTALQGISRLKNLKRLNISSMKVDKKHGFALDLVDISPLKGLKSLEVLNVSEISIGLRELKIISAFKNLKELVLFDVGTFYSRDPEPLSSALSLISLDVTKSSLGVPDLEKFKGLKTYTCAQIFHIYGKDMEGLFNPTLECLDLSSPSAQLIPSGLSLLVSELKKGSALKVLRLKDWPLDEIGLKEISILKGIEELDLSSPRGISSIEVESLEQGERNARFLGDWNLALEWDEKIEQLQIAILEEGVLAMSKLPHLRKLNLERWPLIPRKGLEALCKHPSLESLSLASSLWLTDDFLLELGSLPNLMEVNLKNCKKVTHSGLMNLREEIFKRTGREITVIR